jgi:hypothetical protein
MSALERIAFFQNRRDEVPNQELAKELVRDKDLAGIQEMVANLWHADANVQSDCLKVLYEVGYLEPVLIKDYVEDFLKLLKSKNNRLVWGTMITLSTIARLKADELYPHFEEIKRVMEQGSVITRDNGVKILAGVASTNAEYRKTIFPFLVKHLETCRPKDVPQHSESIVIAVDASTKEAFLAVLEKRAEDLNSTELARVKKVKAKAEKLAAA